MYILFSIIIILISDFYILYLNYYASIKIFILFDLLYSLSINGDWYISPYLNLASGNNSPQPDNPIGGNNWETQIMEEILVYFTWMTKEKEIKIEELKAICLFLMFIINHL